MVEKTSDAVAAKHFAWGWVFVGIIIAAVLVCYLPAVNAPLIFDSTQITTDGSYQVAGPIWEAAISNSRSLVNWTFAQNYRWGYPSTIGYQVVNISIHLVCAVTLFALVRGTLQLSSIPAVFRNHATELAFAAALLWAVHPLQTMAVTYVVQRFESMMAMMFLLAMYFVFCGTISRYSLLWYGVAVFVSFLGMACKPVMVMVAPVILLYDYSCLAGSWRELIKRRWALHLALFATSLWGLYLVRGGFDASLEGQAAGFSLKSITPWEYFRTQPQVLLHYLRLAIWPDVLCIDYAWPIENSPLRIYLPGTVVLLLVAFSIFALFRWPRFGFLATSFFLILAPTSTILPIADLAFEHRMYLPLAPLVVILVLSGYWGIVWVGERLKVSVQPVAWGVLIVIAICLAGRTALRNLDYTDAFRMWSQVLRVRPNNARAHYYVAAHLAQQGHLTEAEIHYLNAMRLAPLWPDSYCGYATLLVKRGDVTKAMSNFRHAVELNPHNGFAYGSWGSAYASLGRYEDAIDKYELAIKYQPNFARTYIRLGEANFELGRFNEALRSFQKVLEIQPDSLHAKLRLAWIYATAPVDSLRDGERSLAIIRSVGDAEESSNPFVLDVYAAAYAETGDFRRALRYARQARHLAQAAQQVKLVDELDERIQVYSENRPFRQAQPAKL